MTSPESTSQKPDVEVQRQMIEQKRDQFKAGGFEFELEIATLKVQKMASGQEEREREKTLQTLRGKAENCYASATALDDMLKALPEKEESKE